MHGDLTVTVTVKVANTGEQREICTRRIRRKESVFRTATNAGKLITPPLHGGG